MKLEVSDFLQLEYIEACGDARAFDNGFDELRRQDTGGEREVEPPEVHDVAFGVVEKKGYGVVIKLKRGLNAFSPLPGQALADSLDDEHGADQVERVLVAGALENVGRESFAADEKLVWC